MPDLAVLDKAFHWTMQQMVESGQAPHYTELASEMGMSMEEGKALVHDLIATGIPAWTGGYITDPGAGPPAAPDAGVARAPRFAACGLAGDSSPRDRIAATPSFPG